jgi:hypothetical protein
MRLLVAAPVFMSVALGCARSSGPAAAPAVPLSQSALTFLRDSVIQGIWIAASAEERFFSDHGTYLAEWTRLSREAPRPLPVDVGVELHAFGPAGYAIVAKHPAWGGRSCVHITSDVRPDPPLATLREGRRAIADSVVCDDP